MSLKAKLNKLIASNYYLACMQYRLRSYTAPLDPLNPVVIYQPGKVGSSSLERSFHQLSLSRPVMKAHNLYKQHMELLRAELGVSAREYYSRHRVEPRSRYLLREVTKARKSGQGDWRFITMVRNPVAQNLSSFFQLLDLIVPDLNEQLRAGTANLDELRTEFLRRYPADCFYNRWFDLEMKASLGIDVLESPFDPEQGFATYKKGCINVLLIRLESMNECASKVIPEYLGIDEFPLLPANRGDEKVYADLYRVFKEEVLLPQSYLDAMYDGRLARRFYSPDEREKFRSAFRVG